MTEEQYHELVESLHLSDPRLNKANFRPTSQSKDKWRPWSKVTGKVIALHLNADDTFGPPTEYTDPSALRIHLQESATCPQSASRSVYILEGLSGDLCSVLAWYFHLHPSLMMDHERLVSCGDRSTGEGGGFPHLPCTIHGRDHVSLKYHEPMILSQQPTGFRNLCEESGRHLAITRLMGDFSSVAVARRKCTFWSTATNSGGWKCLVICDPPIRRILTDYSGRTGYTTSITPYNSGYLDFVPLDSQMTIRSGPPRSSLLDDFLFYLQAHSSLLDLSNPVSLRVFLDKIVASQYLKLAEYLQSNVEIVQWSLSRKQDLSKFQVSSAEEAWSDLQAWERRVAEYQDDLEAIMLQLEIPFDAPNLRSVQGWSDNSADFQHLMIRFREIGQRVRSLNAAMTALASLAGNRASLRTVELSLREYERTSREARSVKALAILGIVFLPLSYSASLFSMAESYLPGSSLFWVYLAVSLPLLAIVVLIYSTVELGYRDPGAQWSLQAATTSLRRSLRVRKSMFSSA